MRPPRPEFSSRHCPDPGGSPPGVESRGRKGTAPGGPDAPDRQPSTSLVPESGYVGCSRSTPIRLARDNLWQSRWVYSHWSRLTACRTVRRRAATGGAARRDGKATPRNRRIARARRKVHPGVELTVHPAPARWRLAPVGSPDAAHGDRWYRRPGVVAVAPIADRVAGRGVPCRSMAGNLRQPVTGWPGGCPTDQDHT